MLIEKSFIKTFSKEFIKKISQLTGCLLTVKISEADGPNSVGECACKHKLAHQ